MSARLRFALWLGAFYAAIVALVATLALLVGADVAEEDRRVLHRALDESGPLLGFLALLVLLACGGILRWLFGRFVAPLRGLAEQTRIVASANIEHRVAAEAGPEVAEVAAAINRLGDAYRGQHRDMQARVADSGSRLEEERNRLAALMSELSEGVLLCNEQGRILLYNEQARTLFARPAAGTFGTAPRNAIYNPGQYQWDIALFKNVSLRPINLQRPARRDNEPEPPPPKRPTRWWHSRE